MGTKEVDEGGLSQQPHRCATWAPRRQICVLESNFNWKTLSAVAGLTMLDFFFRLYAGSVKAPYAVDFLRALARRNPYPQSA